MKNKYDWYENHTTWCVKPRRVIYELLFAPTYRWPMRVTKAAVYQGGHERIIAFPRCPRCSTPMEREYQCFCECCGQRLDWRTFQNGKNLPTTKKDF